jgi:hypothetical protein
MSLENARIYLTRNLDKEPYELCSDGWFRRKYGNSQGYGLMLRKVTLTSKDENSCLTLVKLHYCPSSDDTGLSVETSLGWIASREYETVIELIKYVEENNSKWVP